jgi:PHD/YefM family antitoxin component YafN of YafNO toxin-antitoxin module
MDRIPANELKTKGISAIASRLEDADEVLITVRGKDQFVVMGMNHYNRLREYELEMALHECRAEYERGEYVTESVDNHIKRVSE